MTLHLLKVWVGVLELSKLCTQPLEISFCVGLSQVQIELLISQRDSFIHCERKGSEGSRDSTENICAELFD